MCKEVIIIGAGGHGKVIADIIEKSGDKIFGFLDDDSDKNIVLNYPVIGKIDNCREYCDKWFIIAIGDNFVRKSIAERYNMLKFYTAIHPTAIVSRDVIVDEGSCVMANAVINISSSIGKHVIVNSASVVEHDNVISNFVHVSPGAVLCGTVNIGECTHIGAGAIVRNNIYICDDATIGAGAVVVNNINIRGVYVGVPARMRK